MQTALLTAAAVVSLATSSLYAQNLVFRLTHDDADGVVEVGQAVTYTLTVEYDELDPFGDELILDYLNARIASAPANRVVTSRLMTNEDGSSSGGVPERSGGIAEFRFSTRSTGWGSEFDAPSLRDNPLVVGTFQATPTCAGPIRFQVLPTESANGSEHSVAGYWKNAFSSGPVLSIAETRIQAQSLSAVGSSAGPAVHRVAPGEFDGGADGITALATLPDGDIVVGGEFDSIGGVPVANVSRWDGFGWHAMGGGLDGPVTDLVAASDGTLYAAGVFSASGTAPASSIAQWDGAGWVDVGGGLAGEVEHVAVSPNGEVAAVTLEQIVVDGIPRDRWQVSVYAGGTWTPTYQTLQSFPLNDLAYLSDGQLVASGRHQLTSFSNVKAVLAWNGGEWGPLEPLLPLASVPTTLQPDDDGGLLVATDLGLWRWDTTGWSQLASVDKQIRAALRLDDGRVAVAGEFSSLNGVATDNLAFLNSDQVEPVTRAMDGTINRLAIDASGDLLLSGDFTVPGSPYEQSGIGRLAAIDQPTFCCLAVDYNANGSVETDDLVSFVQRFIDRDEAADLNQDGAIDTGDIGILIQIYTGGCG